MTIIIGLTLSEAILRARADRLPLSLPARPYPAACFALERLRSVLRALRYRLELDGVYTFVVLDGGGIIQSTADARCKLTRLLLTACPPAPEAGAA